MLTMAMGAPGYTHDTMIHFTGGESVFDYENKGIPIRNSDIYSIITINIDSPTITLTIVHRF